MKLNGKLMAFVALLYGVSGIIYADEWGYISKDHYDCESDHMAISTDKGWLLAEAYPPYSTLREGSYIYGDLTGYGFEYVLVFSSRHDDSPEKAKIYIDNYWMSDDDAAKYCFAGEDL